LALLKNILVFALLAATPAFAGSLDVGDRLERIDLVDRKGAPVSLADLDGKIVILDFWASWCAPCRPTLGALEGIARRYAALDVVVLAVNVDERRRDAEKFLDERFADSAIRFAYDPGRRLLAEVGADGFPAIYVLDRERTVRFAEAGFSVDEMAEVEREVAYLQGLGRSSAEERAGTYPARP
jgi:cytochrome c biogenesis protein CcmG, thiol:disulfide interchange protein DsbE